MKISGTGTPGSELLLLFCSGSSAGWATNPGIASTLPWGDDSDREGDTAAELPGATTSVGEAAGTAGDDGDTTSVLLAAPGSTLNERKNTLPGLRFAM